MSGGHPLMHRINVIWSGILHDFGRYVVISLGLVLGGCMMGTPPAPKPVAPVARTIPQGTRATHPLLADEGGFLRLSNTQRGQTPVRVGILLPFSNGSSTTRALAASMMRSAELALFDSQNHNLLLISADEGSGGADAVAGARSLLAEGAEIIVGPLFSQSVTSVAPITRDHAVPMISFSSDRAVAGDGVYLLSFQPENEVNRIVGYAVGQGHSAFAGLVPDTAYGMHVARAFASTVKAAGGRVVDEERFVTAGGAVSAPALKVAQSKPDAVLIAQGGALLREIVASLTANGAGSKQVQFLGTGLWDDSATTHEPALVGGWFAAPDPDLARGFDAKFRAMFGSSPPALASLAYDAVSLAAALASGPAYHRFTASALTDPNGFSGVDGVFRLDVDGSSERGLAVLKIEPGGNVGVLSPAPRSFLPTG
jgi:ABC-type branched-subunit amino acid transport system substrate-binding protein